MPREKVGTEVKITLPSWHRSLPRSCFHFNFFFFLLVDSHAVVGGPCLILGTHGGCVLTLHSAGWGEKTQKGDESRESYCPGQTRLDLVY